MDFSKIRNFLLTVTTVMIFLNLTDFVPGFRTFPLPGYFVDIFIFLFLFIFYKRYHIRLPFNHIAVVFLVYYVIINTIYFALSPTGLGEITEFKTIIFYILIFLYILMYLNLDDDNLTHIRKIMIFISFIAVATLGVDFVSDGYFQNMTEEGRLEFIPGRAASSFVNANIAGGAISIFLIFAIDLIPVRLRTPYILFLFVGLLFTMSRSNIIIFAVLLMILFFQRKLKATQLVGTFMATVLLMLWLSFGGIETIEHSFGVEFNQGIKDRINFFVDKDRIDSDLHSVNERSEALEHALKMFLDKPITGNGFAATRTWDFNVSPHNTYAMHWAEFGLLGMTFVPLYLFWASRNVFRYGSRSQRQFALLVIIYIVLSCMFSHNMLHQKLNIAIVLAVAIMGYKSKNRFLSAR